MIREKKIPDRGNHKRNVPRTVIGFACLNIQLSTVAGGGKVEILFLMSWRYLGTAKRPAISRGCVSLGFKGTFRLRH